MISDNSAEFRGSYYKLSKEFEDLLSTQRKKNTLVKWRLSDDRLVDVMRDFAVDGKEYAEDDKDFTKFLKKTLELFDDLNPLLAKQEQGNEYFLSKQPKNTHEKKEISVVFGGKYVTEPESIPETLVSNLAKDNPRIFTVSRSEPPRINDENSSKVKHFKAKYLDSNSEKGKNEYLKVLKAAVEEWQNSFADHTLVIYLTLGFFKDKNPYERNLYVAQNFCDALKECFTGEKSGNRRKSIMLRKSLISKSVNGDSSINTKKNWRVVLTGTDATLPSTAEDDTFIWKKHGEKDEKLTIPSYKITEYNYVYAMSKLGQYYMVANTVAQLLNGSDALQKELKSTIKKIEKKVFEAAKSGTLKEFLRTTLEKVKNRGKKKPQQGMSVRDSVIDKTVKQSILELDEISRGFNEIRKREKNLLQNHFWIAEGISICYTPLHGKPWAKEATGKENPRIFVLQQIIFRLKNAISLEQAVALHFSNSPY